MHRYEIATPRVTLGIAAIATTAITFGLLVITPAALETVASEPVVLASHQLAGNPQNSANCAVSSGPTVATTVAPARGDRYRKASRNLRPALQLSDFGAV